MGIGSLTSRLAYNDSKELSEISEQSTVKTTQHLKGLKDEM